MTTLNGTHRLAGDAYADTTPITAEGPDYQTAYDALLAQVPAGQQLLHVIEGD